jgi:hypothetical protein
MAFFLDILFHSMSVIDLTPTIGTVSACSFRIRSRCLLDNSAGQRRPIFQGNGCAVGLGFVALVTQSVCKFMPNRKIKQVFDQMMLLWCSNRRPLLLSSRYRFSAR